jgi:hypothetical protein
MDGIHQIAPSAPSTTTTSASHTADIREGVERDGPGWGMSAEYALRDPDARTPGTLAVRTRDFRATIGGVAGTPP